MLDYVSELSKQCSLSLEKTKIAAMRRALSALLKYRDSPRRQRTWPLMEQNLLPQRLIQCFIWW
jgi:hypothetical protein